MEGQEMVGSVPGTGEEAVSAEVVAEELSASQRLVADMRGSSVPELIEAAEELLGTRTLTQVTVMSAEIEAMRRAYVFLTDLLMRALHDQGALPQGYEAEMQNAMMALDWFRVSSLLDWSD